MSLSAIANQGLAMRLSPRLDACVATVQRCDPGGIVQEHGASYAGFLSDLSLSRIAADDQSVARMLNLVVEYCDLIEREYPVASRAICLRAP